MKTKSPSDNEKKTTSEKPISLAGINFKKLLSAFLKVKPDEEEKPAEKQEDKPNSLEE